MASLAMPSVFHDMQIPLMLINIIIALAIGPQRRVVQIGYSLPVLVILASQSLYKKRRFPWGTEYALECAVLCHCLIYVDWVLLANPDKEGWHKLRDRLDNSKNREEVGKMKKAHLIPQRFWRRLWWGMRLATSSRYVGWSCEVKNVPVEVAADYPKLHFIIRKALRSACFYILADTCKAYTTATPYGSWAEMPHVGPGKRFADQPFLTRFWYVWVHIILTYASMEQLNSAYGALSVMVGLASPTDCPSAFGDLKRLATIRQAWSSVWHQQCRRLVSTPGIYIVRNVLQLPKGSFASKYIQLFSSFLFSAIVHGVASMLVNKSFDDDSAFEFFLGQAGLIMVEDHLIKLGKSMGFRDSRLCRMIGFLWTVFVLGVSFENLSSKTIGRGMWGDMGNHDIFGLGTKATA